MDRKETLVARFESAFEHAPSSIVHAPGRVNLIGEHTDYNQGFVFPAAINFGTFIAASKRSDNEVHAIAMDYDNEENRFSIEDIRFDTITPWANYVRGVLKVLKKKYPQVGGANFMITGNVPQGAGLSSSASFEIAVLKACKEIFKIELDGITAALLGQEAENNFVGCSCGIMDQLISAMGREGHAMLLDCRSLQIQHIPLPSHLRIVIINSNVKRGLVDSEYNLRRQQCEQAARAMSLQSLREADMTLLQSHKNKMPDPVYRRAKHIISDNSRTLAMVEALNQGDMTRVSDLMAASHISMRDDFEITVPPIDYLVEIVSATIGAEGGVRMTGGGFGGCVVALVPEYRVTDVCDTVAKLYQKKTGYKADIYQCTAEQGAFA